MKSPNIFIRNTPGFTLVETLIAITIMIILFGVSAPYTVKFYNQFQLDSERSTMLSLLRQARTMSMATENSQSHGLYFDATTYTIFEGGSYAGRDVPKDQTFPRETHVIITGPNEFLFRNLTGRTASKSWILDNGSKTSKINVNSEGRIDWR